MISYAPSTASPAADQYGRKANFQASKEETVLKEQGPSGFWWMTSEKPPWPWAHGSARARTVKFTCWAPTPPYKAEMDGDSRSRPGHTTWGPPRGTSHSLARRRNDNPQPSPLLQRPLRRRRGNLKHIHLQTTTKCYLNLRHHHVTLTSDSSTSVSPSLLPGVFTIVCFRVFVQGCRPGVW